MFQTIVILERIVDRPKMVSCWMEKNPTANIIRNLESLALGEVETENLGDGVSLSQSLSQSHVTIFFRPSIDLWQSVEIKVIDKTFLQEDPMSL